MLAHARLPWFGVFAAIFALVMEAPAAQAYIGPSFLNVPGVEGDARERPYRGWVQLEGNYWNTPRPLPPIYTGPAAARFSGPLAPAEGAGVLAVAVSKQSAGYGRLMELCARASPIPELTFAESSERSRPPSEFARRPSDVPEYFEYTLRDVRLSCPVANDAEHQGLVLNFAHIEWRNFRGAARENLSSPARLPAAQTSGRRRAYIVTWFNAANSVNPDPENVSAEQCPVISTGPSEEDYFRYRSEDEIAAARAASAAQGGVLAAAGIRGGLAYRGPGQLSVGYLPGIVPDPGHPSPALPLERGFDLDGDGDLDNAFFHVDGCIPGHGPTGILTVTTTESRRNGEISMMVLISGIDDEHNDNRVDVTLFYSDDPMAKSADGASILPGYTYRVSQAPQWTPYFQRVRGRIVDGVVLTDPTDVMEIDKSREIARFFEGRMRLRLNPDRTLSGEVGGYQDWRTIADHWGTFTILEDGLRYRSPAVYNALRRAADGLPDRASGQMMGISTTYDIRGVEAFLPPEEEALLLRAGAAYAQAPRTNAARNRASSAVASAGAANVR